jgi:hypothetical protein
MPISRKCDTTALKGKRGAFDPVLRVRLKPKPVRLESRRKMGLFILGVAFLGLVCLIVGVKLVISLSWQHDWIGAVICALGLIAMLASLPMSINWWSAKKDANFINKTYGTAYTQEDLFWNGDEIKTMVIGSKNRIKIEN